MRGSAPRTPIYSAATIHPTAPRDSTRVETAIASTTYDRMSLFVAETTTACRETIQAMRSQSQILRSTYQIQPTLATTPRLNSCSATLTRASPKR
jgi:paraquat-inducible protein B